MSSVIGNMFGTPRDPKLLDLLHLLFVRSLPCWLSKWRTIPRKGVFGTTLNYSDPLQIVWYASGSALPEFPPKILHFSHLCSGRFCFSYNFPGNTTSHHRTFRPVRKGARTLQSFRCRLLQDCRNVRTQSTFYEMFTILNRLSQVN